MDPRRARGGAAEPGQAGRLRSLGIRALGARAFADNALGARARNSKRYKWWVLWVSLSGLLATNLLFTVFVVALPQVARGLHTSVATITWVVTGPLLSFAVVAPLAGKAGDLWGHKRLFLTGIALEALVAVMSATAPSAGVLIAARTVGGLVGASVGAGSMALVLSVFDANERVKALGFWSLVGAGGPVLGVAIGGPVIEAFGWRAMFALQAPLLLLAAALALSVLPERAAHRERAPGTRLELDWAGAVSIATCVGAFLFALNRGPEWGWRSPAVIGAFAVSLLAGGSFYSSERRAKEPILPLHYLRRRNFVFPVAAQGFSNFAYLGGFFMAPLLLEECFGFAHRQGIVGFLVMPRPLVFSAIAPIAGYFAVRAGERTASVAGTVAVVASMAVFTVVERSTGLALVEVGLVLSGAGLGISAPSLSASVANEFEARDLGAASASMQLVSQVGTVAGIQVMQTVQAAALAASHGRGESALLGSFHAAFAVGAAVAVLAVVGAALSRSTNRATDRSKEASVDLTEALDATEKVPVLREAGELQAG